MKMSFYEEEATAFSRERALLPVRIRMLTNVTRINFFHWSTTSRGRHPQRNEEASSSFVPVRPPVIAMQSHNDGTRGHSEQISRCNLDANGCAAYSTKLNTPKH